MGLPLKTLHVVKTLEAGVDSLEGLGGIRAELCMWHYLQFALLDFSFTIFNGQFKAHAAYLHNNVARALVYLH